ncbi:hypothetical protein AB1Y20_022686 [Prymnesium parvum]|uniref:Fe2OG dioxygenase domain-containing protein n=1 Tax=Prymnesium parvum TaxID=97485 RepID=A0AB34JJS1_PRYPA
MALQARRSSRLASPWRLGRRRLSSSRHPHGLAWARMPAPPEPAPPSPAQSTQSAQLAQSAQITPLAPAVRPRAVADALSALGTNDLDGIGAGAPVVELEKLDLGADGVRGAIERQDSAAFARVAKELGRSWWVALEWGDEDMSGPFWGGSANTWRAICEEGRRVWPLMEAGKLIRADGEEVVGASPSGKPRGDRFVVGSDSRLRDGQGRPTCPTLQALERALNLLGDLLAAPLANEPRVGFKLVARTHSLFACFPGEGSEYGAHFDGGNGDPRKLTAILYLNEGWQPEDGGELLMYDATRAEGPCWRSVMPRAGTLVLFRADRVLHKVSPSYKMRFALTMFFGATYGNDHKHSKQRNAHLEKLRSLGY